MHTVGGVGDKRSHEEAESNYQNDLGGVGKAPNGPRARRLRYLFSQDQRGRERRVIQHHIEYTGHGEKAFEAAGGDESHSSGGGADEGDPRGSPGVDFGGAGPKETGAAEGEEDAGGAQ